MAETDLYPPIKRYLEAQGYEVKGEIGRCDVVAVRGDEPPVIVELKTAFNLKLLLQGMDRQAMTDAVYLAIPALSFKNRKDVHGLCRRMGLGLLTVHGKIVEAEIDPAPYAPRKNQRRKELLLKEFSRRKGDPNAGGSTKKPLVTAYRQDALRCAMFLDAKGAAQVAAIRAEARVERAAAIMRSDVYGWFAKRERGVYGLTAEGKSALAQFSTALPLL
jgi:hypothetical protein